MTIQEMLQKRGELLARMEALTKIAPEERTEEQKAEFKSVTVEIDKLDLRIKEAQDLEHRKQQFPPAEPNRPDPNDPGIRGGVPTVEVHEPDVPFNRQLGAFLQFAVRSQRPGANYEQELRSFRETPECRAAGDGATIAVGPEGGVMVPDPITDKMFARVIEDNTLLSNCTVDEMTTGNSKKVPMVDETSRANGSRHGGVVVYSEAEEDQITSSKFKLSESECKLVKYAALMYASNETVEDAPYFGSLANRLFTAEMGFKIQDHIFRGDGAGRLLGILKSNCLISVAKETNQASDTVVAMNLAKMLSRLPLESRNSPGLFWVYNQELLPQLMTMTIDNGTSSVPVFLPPGGFSSAPYETIFGKAAIPIEQCSAPGDVGDIGIVDMRQYQILKKSGGTKMTSSIHVKFEYDQIALRWVLRIGGQPLWKTALTPYKGSTNFKISPFVTLAAR